MNLQRQRAYLEALDTPVWVLRDQQEAADQSFQCGLRMGPGSGQVLFVCAQTEESSGKLAADIARCVRSQPIWAWPDAGMEANLETTVAEQLLTDVVVFGEAVAGMILGKNLPQLIGSAAVHQAPSFESLHVDPAARQRLWALLCDTRLAGPRKIKKAV